MSGSQRRSRKRSAERKRKRDQKRRAAARAEHVRSVAERKKLESECALCGAHVCTERDLCPGCGERVCRTCNVAQYPNGPRGGFRPHPSLEGEHTVTVHTWREIPEGDAAGAVDLEGGQVPDDLKRPLPPVKDGTEIGERVTDDLTVEKGGARG